MSSVAMWRGCRWLWWAHSPPARLPRPPPAHSVSGPVGSCGRRAYAPPTGEGAAFGEGDPPLGTLMPGSPRAGLGSARPRCWGCPPRPFPGVNVSLERAGFAGSTAEPSLNQFVTLVFVFCWVLGILREWDSDEGV